MTEIEDIEMDSNIEEIETNYLDETDVADDGSTLVSFMTPSQTRASTAQEPCRGRLAGC